MNTDKIEFTSQNIHPIFLKLPYQLKDVSFTDALNKLTELGVVSFDEWCLAGVTGSPNEFYITNETDFERHKMTFKIDDLGIITDVWLGTMKVYYLSGFYTQAACHLLEFLKNFVESSSHDLSEEEVKLEMGDIADPRWIPEKGQWNWQFPQKIENEVESDRITIVEVEEASQAYRDNQPSFKLKMTFYGNFLHVMVPDNLTVKDLKILIEKENLFAAKNYVHELKIMSGDRLLSEGDKVPYDDSGVHLRY